MFLLCLGLVNRAVRREKCHIPHKVYVPNGTLSPIGQWSKVVHYTGFGCHLGRTQGPGTHKGLFVCRLRGRGVYSSIALRLTECCLALQISLSGWMEFGRLFLAISPFLCLHPLYNLTGRVTEKRGREKGGRRERKQQQSETEALLANQGLLAASWLADQQALTVSLQVVPNI